MLSVPGLQEQRSSGSVDLPATAHLLMQAKADGVQIYICTQTEKGIHWALKGPNAKLFDDAGNTIGIHFAGPSWKLADGGEVQGELIASKPSPDANSIPWLLLRAKAGTATGSLAKVDFIKRTDTHGGVADEAGCSDRSHIARTIEAHYTATYSFYSAK